MKCIRSDGDKRPRWVRRLTLAVKRGWAKLKTLARSVADATLDMFVR